MSPPRRKNLSASARSRPSAVRPIVAFVLRFLGLWALALLLFTFVPRIEELAIANTVGSLVSGAKTLGLKGIQTGEYLHIGGVSIRIVRDCTPLMPIAGLWAAVLAFPASAIWKLAGLVAGAIVLWLYNLLRIYALMAVLAARPGWFDFIHVYLWQTVTLVVVFGLFVAWLRLLRRTELAARDAPI